MYRPRRLQFLAQPNPDDEDGPPPSTHMARRLVILAEMPFVVPFEERVLVRFSYHLPFFQLQVYIFFFIFFISR